ncbi:MAG: bb3-type cytochrome oxidase subunit III [Planctomycetes bacterium]|nr:bb3-type cytochrome oxidase subunit III [Planctomycetota bacterium]
MNAALEAPRPIRVGFPAFLAVTTMLFTAFTASYLVRRAAEAWTPVALPWAAYANLALLAAASASLEGARRTGRMGRTPAGRRGAWLAGAAIAGTSFLASQLLVWRSLAAAGVFLATSPHGSFFYLLSAVHGAHLLGGLAALAWAAVRPAGLGACTAWWHFLFFVWVWVLVLLSGV